MNGVQIGENKGSLELLPEILVECAQADCHLGKVGCDYKKQLN